LPWLPFAVECRPESHIGIKSHKALVFVMLAANSLHATAHDPIKIPVQ